MSMLIKNNIYRAGITGYTHDALGVCRIDENNVFVPGAIKGEEEDILIVKVRNGVSYGKIAGITRPSPERTDPLCPYYKLCGGCSTRHMSYKEELSFKLSRVNSALKHIGNQTLVCEKIIPAEHTERYRNKAVFNISSGSTGAFAGFYKGQGFLFIA